MLFRAFTAWEHQEEAGKHCCCLQLRVRSCQLHWLHANKAARRRENQHSRCSSPSWRPSKMPSVPTVLIRRFFLIPPGKLTRWNEATCQQSQRLLLPYWASMQACDGNRQSHFLGWWQPSAIALPLNPKGVNMASCISFDFLTDNLVSWFFYCLIAGRRKVRVVLQVTTFDSYNHLRTSVLPLYLKMDAIHQLMSHFMPFSFPSLSLYEGGFKTTFNNKFQK